MALFARTLRASLPSARPALQSARGLTTVSHTLETGNVPDALLHSNQHTSSNLEQKVDSPPAPPHTPPSPAAPAAPNARQDVVATHLTPSIRQLLPLLTSQPAHYITAHIHGRPYLLTPGDTLRLPFLMPNVEAGDVLRLNRATHIGSRDYTLKAPAAIKGTADHGKIVHYLDERLFTCRATVVGVESEPMRVMEKTKRRQRHVKHVFSKHKYTVLRVGEVEVKTLEQYEEALKNDGDA
ncbi:hypothetical protein DPSP01_011358 [Paraphaeosphaeria sporulosa]|uniref:Large ribosomal subunit protein bL21m n=1 Tax=Paraphaeosphaeria sporulosa TaxID=1460663 RepID=A0A177CPJ8_9PLEO|nr:54S ribosomal protein L49, mitochondrial precursor [Paraphaeosphaeria sporulosa]OAG08709.1 54S ribosomal protein L49, mitochondrial precursor [Paraphaeosphaeria sporulosa]